MKLKELLKSIKGCKIQGSEDTEILDIQYDSRAVVHGSLFVAIKGEKADGNLFAKQAIEKGAVAVVTDEECLIQGAATIRVDNSREALARLSAAFYGEPARKLRLVGITGTNGKTTTSFLIESILREAGLNPGVIGTISYRYAGKVLPAPNTTPESLDLQRLLRDMVDSGVKAVVMEVSSHALAQDRVAGCIFDVGVFTNLTQDHLDYHGTMDSYFAAKARLFTDFIDEGRAAVINMDDPKGEELSKRSVGRVIGYSKAGKGRGKESIYPKDIRFGVDGIKGTIATPSGDINIKSSLVGEFNLHNILAAVGAGLGLGLPVDAIEKGIESLKNVPGRLERVDAGQAFTILVDYAHTPDALERVLSTLKGLTDKRIITVFGCGGDRDRGKRPIMGSIAVRYSDMVVVTSDNPRTEEPLRIIEDIKAGMREGSYMTIPDRREAIKAAIENAKEGDVVLLAGKGHEDYQIIGKEKTHFDDREEAVKAVNSE